MKFSIVLVLVTLSTLYLQGQKLPPFGKIEKKELEYKQCEYDKTADAECLIDYGEVNYFVSGNAVINEATYRVRIKIFNEKSLDRSNVRIRYYSKGNRDYVSKISGVTYNLNDKGEIEKTELEKDAIYKQKVNNYYDEIVFSLPKVKPGSVFEYKYSILKRNVLRLDNWNFQQRIPVRFSMYDVGIPSVLGFTYKVKRTLPGEERTEDGTQGVRRKVFIMQNIPGLKNEPYMSTAADYYQRVEFQLTGIAGMIVPGNTWKEFAEELLDDEDFGLQIKKNILKNLPIQHELKMLADPYQKIRMIYHYVQKNVAWDGTNHYWCANGVKQALEKHEGNSADLNILLLNLLRDADITAYPLLVSTRSHGKINISFPFKEQFDNVYVYVLLNDQQLVLDATNKNSPPHIGPWDVQFSNAFLVDKQFMRILTIGDTKHRYKITAIVNTEITQEGDIKGNAKVYAHEYARVERLSALREGKEHYKKNYFTQPYPQFSFESIATFNEDKDSLSLETHADFKGKLNSSGEYLFYQPNLLIEMDENPFLAEERFSDIEFGYNQYYTIISNIRFPENYELEELPKNIKMILPDTSIILNRIMQRNENLISYRITLEINRPYYFAEEYADFREFFAKLIEKLNEQIVFKKKANP